MSDRGFTRLAWGVFGYSLLAILWGYFLRISESGDGCGTDWPLCRAVVTSDSPEFATWVELTHRLSSGLVLIGVLALMIWAFRAYPRGSAVRFGATAALVFTISESLFGAVLVLFGWVAGDISTGRILIRPVHVTNTFFLIAALALTPYWASRGIARVPKLEGPTARLLLVAIVGALALAWTGAWTGLAATAFAADSLREGLSQYLEPEHLLVTLRLAHPLLAVGVVLLLLRTSSRLRANFSDPILHRLAGAVAALAVAQLVVGPIAIALGNPVWARILHLALADALWVALVLAGATALSEAAGDVSRARPGGSSESSARA
jgi:heme A synthase